MADAQFSPYLLSKLGLRDQPLAQGLGLTGDTATRLLAEKKALAPPQAVMGAPGDVSYPTPTDAPRIPPEQMLELLASSPGASLGYLAAGHPELGAALEGMLAGGGAMAGAIKPVDPTFAEQIAKTMGKTGGAVPPGKYMPSSAAKDYADEVKRIAEVASQDPITPSREAMLDVSPGRVKSLSEIMNDPQFRRWFGQSKAVTPQGLPQVLAHGTASPTEFEFGNIPYEGTHLGTPQAAAERIATRASSGYEMPYRTRPVFLSAQNPYEVEDYGYWPPHKFFEDLTKRGVLTREEEGALRQEAQVAPGTEATYDVFRNMLKRTGIDSFIYKNMVEAPGSKSWIAPFPAEQIRSVFGPFGGPELSGFKGQPAPDVPWFGLGKRTQPPSTVPMSAPVEYPAPSSPVPQAAAQFPAQFPGTEATGFTHISPKPIEGWNYAIGPPKGKMGYQTYWKHPVHTGGNWVNIGDLDTPTYKLIQPLLIK